MIEWLAAVPSAVWAAAVTGAFLVSQQVFNGRREDRRRAADAVERAEDRDRQSLLASTEREHLAAEARLEREHQQALLIAGHENDREAARQADERARVAKLGEQWSDRRLEAHQQLLPALERALEEVDGARVMLVWSDDGIALESSVTTALSEHTKDELRALAATVAFVGSEQAQRIASKCTNDIIALSNRVGLSSDREFIESRMQDGSYEAGYGKDALRQQYWDSRQLIREYLTAVREELGTSVT